MHVRKKIMKRELEMEIKLCEYVSVYVCICVWQADFQHVGKQFDGMIEYAMYAATRIAGKSPPYI